MNRQVGYIVYALLGLSLLPLSYCTYGIISASQTEQVKEEVSIEKKNPIASASVLKGEIIFQSKCLQCHNLFRDVTGPSLINFQERGPWQVRTNVYEWIRNPAAFIKKNEYAKELKDKFGVMMTGFPELTNEEIDAICDYIEFSAKAHYASVI